MLGLVLGILFVPREKVLAVDYTVQYSGDHYDNVCFNRYTGGYISYYSSTGPFDNRCGSNGRDVIKKVNGNFVYCVNWTIELSPDGIYREVNSNDTDKWYKNWKAAIMAGKIIDTIKAEEQGNSARMHSNTAAAINTLFASEYVRDSKAANFPNFRKYVDSASKWYDDTVKQDSTLPNISFSITGSSTDNKVLSQLGSGFISNAVTISGFVSKYGGDAVSYTISGSTSNNKNVSLCTKANGTDCKNSVSVSGSSSNVVLYVKVGSDVSSTDSVTLKVSGSNKSVYPSTILYKASNGQPYQRLIQRVDLTYNRSVNKSINFVVPNLVNHMIVANKVDESGNSLSGATLEIYKDDYTKSSNRLATNNGSGSSVYYVSDKTIENDDDFLKHNYYLVEKKSPDGYVLNDSNRINKFFDVSKDTSNSSSTCYYSNGGEISVAEAERCNASNYDYRCKRSDNGGIEDLDESGNCEFSAPKPSDAGDGTGSSESDTSEETPVTYEKVCTRLSDKTVVDKSYCDDKDSYVKVSKNGGNLTVTQLNTKNLVRISKQDITGDAEVSGATLKICTADDYGAKKDDCTPAKTIDNIELRWVSGNTAYEFTGLPVDRYYIIEETAPQGYIKASTAIEFSIDETGSVKSGNQTITNGEFKLGTGAIVVNNELTKMSVSKQDIATAEELPGAKLSICLAYFDENDDAQILKDQYTGDCIEATLPDGSKATWESGNEPKVIRGLEAGNYYLVEKVAPSGYSTTESVLFTLKSDGTLTDKDGNSLAENKLVMHDKAIQEVKTGSLPLYIMIFTLISMVILGIGSYCYLNMASNSDKGIDNNYTDTEMKNGKIRQRRIHKRK